MKIVFLSLSLVLINPLTSVAQFFQKSDILLSYPQTEGVRDKYSPLNSLGCFADSTPLGHWKSRSLQHLTTNVRTISKEGRTFMPASNWWLKLFIDYCLRNGLTYTDYTCKSIDDQNFEYPWFAGRSTKEADRIGFLVTLPFLKISSTKSTKHC